jgi:hypothetical protein
MRVRIYLMLISGLSLLSSSAVMAHANESGIGSLGRLLHLFTGEHLLTLVLIAVCAAGVIGLLRRYR